MDIEEALIDYIESSPASGQSIQSLIDSNCETYFVNLEDVRAFSNDLYNNIHQAFRTKYDVLRRAFRSYAVKAFGAPLDLSFYNPAIHVRLRDLRSAILGSLVSFSGTATRSSQVRPELAVGAFVCKDCGTKIRGVRQEFKYTEPLFCPNQLCSNRTKYEVDLSDSQFNNWQKIHVQECMDEIPNGSLPRTMDVIVRNELIEKIKPGSQLRFTGYTVVVPADNVLAASRSAPVLEGVADEKVRRTTRDLNYKMCFFCIHADVAVASTLFSERELATVQRIQTVPNLYEKLAESLFPTIHGHANIKAAILLMLAGGVAKSRDIRLRGDINVLLVGDPGTAKSQFLKQTSAVHPRAVYTSGKSSSAAGLTAAVVKDTETGEFTIEAGALMLSDTGVCCIDEFDKMTYKDQVSIHEAMEQQTITIAKAGINACLNSRTSVLAAANPIKGRYDKRKTLRQNVNLSAPIMSRFDLYFVLIDDINAENDKKVSMRILGNHLLFNSGGASVADGKGGSVSDGRTAVSHALNQTADQDENRDNACLKDSLAGLSKPFTTDEVMLYIRYIKAKKPQLSQEGMDMLVSKYTSLRQDSLVNTNNYKMTPRHLESLIRLSEALAKIHNDTTIGVAYVQEAYRLLKSSVIEVSGEDIDLACKEGGESFVITSKDYLKIMNSLVYLIKSEKYTREQLCLRYLELIEDSIGSVEMLESERKKCLKTIDFLIENEGVLFEVDGVVYIHPNYDN